MGVYHICMCTWDNEGWKMNSHQFCIFDPILIPWNPIGLSDTALPQWIFTFTGRTERYGAWWTTGRWWAYTFHFGCRWEKDYAIRVAWTISWWRTSGAMTQWRMLRMTFIMLLLMLMLWWTCRLYKKKMLQLCINNCMNSSNEKQTVTTKAMAANNATINKSFILAKNFVQLCTCDWWFTDRSSRYLYLKVYLKMNTKYIEVDGLIFPECVNEIK